MLRGRCVDLDGLRAASRRNAACAAAPPCVNHGMVVTQARSGARHPLGPHGSSIAQDYIKPRCQGQVARRPHPRSLSSGEK